MKLKDLLKDYPHKLISGSSDLEISSLAYDSREVTPGCLFFAITGIRFDGHEFLDEAFKNGAVAAVVSRESQRGQIPLIQVANPRQALADLAARFYDFPSEEIFVMGITGTNGKTTVTYLIEQILSAAGYKVALLGTIENRINGQKIDHKMTTPESLDLQKILRQAVDEGCTFAVMEVSSHSVVMDRVRWVKFGLKLLTNITQDHLDFHKTFEAYREVKIGWMKQGEAIKIWPLDWQKEKIPKKFPLVGKFNFENAQCVKAVCRALKIEEKIIDSALLKAKSAPGRFEKTDAGQDFLVIVDYAHTPDGLEKVLRAAREITAGKIITVFGCGGDRDKTKRPKMGKIAAELSDFTIITSDNPRSEDPLEIIKEIEKGFENGRYEIEPDRTKAIEKAIQRAKKGDLVLLAGKGHEDYQIFRDKTIHFDDREVARGILKRK